MEKDMLNLSASTSSPSSDMQLCPASPDAQEIFRPIADNSDVSAGNFRPIPTMKTHQQNPRKKRTKMIRLHQHSSSSKAVVGVSSGSMISKPKYGKKPDPTAPKITRPCTECGKRFWSWKALFGHMRCHPERPWRGINPPPNVHHQQPPPLLITSSDWINVTTEEDRQVAGSLLLLANGQSPSDRLRTIIATTTAATISYQYHHNQSVSEAVPIRMEEVEGGAGHPGMNFRFECSSCKKVFGSHQALGGHRASHKNVKGCFAITRNDGGEEVEEGELEGHDVRNCEEGETLTNNGSQQQHQCSICLRVFSSGQALGGHKRCHWEKEDVVPDASTSVPSLGYHSGNVHLPSFRFDLNLPAPLEENNSASSSSSLALDLRLVL